MHSAFPKPGAKGLIRHPVRRSCRSDRHFPFPFVVLSATIHIPTVPPEYNGLESITSDVGEFEVL